MGALAATTGSVILLSPLRCRWTLGNGPQARKRTGPPAAQLVFHDPRQEAAHDPARQPARLLRRRRSRDPDRRARASSATARRSMSATRSSTTASWSRAWRPRARSSSRSSTRCPTTGRWSSPPTACRKRCRPRPARRKLLYLDATCPLVSKVHREAERHADAGRTVILIGHAGHPEVIGTMGQLPRGHGRCWSRTWRRPRRSTCADPQQPRLCHADHAVGRRHGRHRRRAAPPLPGDPGPARGRHLLRHHQPPGGGEGDRRALRRAGGDRRAEFLQLDAAGRGRGELRLRQVAPGAARRRHGLGAGWATRGASASPPAPRRPRCWSTS